MTAAFNVLTNKHLVKYITNFQSGIKGKDWHDGDLAAKLGHLDIVENKLGLDLTFTENAINLAAAAGNLEMVKLLHKKNLPCTEDAIDDAAANGHLLVVKFLVENRSEGFSELAMGQAAANGHLDVLKYLARHDGCLNYDVPIEVAKNGHLEVLKWLLENFKTIEKNQRGVLMNTAISSNNLEMVKWLYENGFKKVNQSHHTFPHAFKNPRIRDFLVGTMKLKLPKINSELAAAIMTYGALEDLKELEKREGKFTPNMIMKLLPIAITLKHKNLVEYLVPENHTLGVVDLNKLAKHAIQVPNFQPEIAELLVTRGATLAGCNIRAAVFGNNFSLVRKIYEQNKVLPPDILSPLEEIKNYEMIKWLIEKGAQLDQDELMGDAIQMGNIEIVELLVRHGLKLTPEYAESALGSNNPLMFKWLNDKGLIKASKDFMESALELAHYPAVKFLVGKGFKITRKGFEQAAAQGNIQLVKLCHQQNVKYSKEVMDSAAENGHLAVVIFLHEHYPQGCSKEALKMAIHEGHLAVVKWLTKNRSEISRHCIKFAIDNGYLAMTKWLFLNRTDPEPSMRDSFIPNIPTKLALSRAKEYGNLFDWMEDLRERYKICYQQVTGKKYLEVVKDEDNDAGDPHGRQGDDDQKTRHVSVYKIFRQHNFENKITKKAVQLLVDLTELIDNYQGHFVDECLSIEMQKLVAKINRRTAIEISTNADYIVAEIVTMCTDFKRVGPAEIMTIIQNDPELKFMADKLNFTF